MEFVMNRIHLAAAAAIASALVLSAPAAAERIRLVNINGYNVIDSQHLVLNGGATRHYLVTLQRRCDGLRSGAAIGTSFPSTATLSLLHMEYLSTALEERCYIDTIEPVASLEAARGMLEQRALESEAAR
tara:strand:- start:19311 stop:19700 length:390 start_codon:yes stop_codon:yes gene_type:complete